MAEVMTKSRELDKRETFERAKSWAPPALLPEPEPEPGYTFRWVRLSTLNQDDPTNLSSKLREGWEPVTAQSQPKMRMFATQTGRFADSIQIGGLMLCKIPAEFMDQRADYYRQQAEQQMKSVDSNFMRENDPRMPLFSEKRSQVSFGRGS